MAYEVVLTDLAASEVKALRRYDGRRIGDEIRGQLTQTPKVQTRNRKCLGNIPAGFEYLPPLWELRVVNYRVFYDVDDNNQVVTVHAVRRKAPDQRTEDIVQ